MNTYSTNKNERHPLTNETAQKKSVSKGTSQFIDNRPEGIIQTAIQKAAYNSFQSGQLAKYQQMADDHTSKQNLPVQKKENKTGLPDELKSGIESLSAMSMDHVKTHYNSNKPAQLNAHAFAQGSDIYLSSGQEKHLPHEAWHVIQQAQGRVKPTVQMESGVPVNDDAGLEKEADMMGAKANQIGSGQNIQLKEITKPKNGVLPVQRLANRHGITMPQYVARSGFTTFGWGRLTSVMGANFNLPAVTANVAGHAEDQLITAAGIEIALNPGTYDTLEIWISSSPCSTAYGTRVGIASGCLEDLQVFAATNGMTVLVHAQKPYQPRGLGPGMKQNSVNAALGGGIAQDFDNRTGIANVLTAYAPPPGIMLGTVAQLAGIEDESEIEKKKKEKGKVIITYE